MPARPTAQEKAETLAWLRRISGDLATVTNKRLEDSLPWYAEMPPARRSTVGLVAQAGISSFIQWYEDPTSTPRIAADIFAAAPRELLRSVSRVSDALTNAQYLLPLLTVGAAVYIALNISLSRVAVWVQRRSSFARKAPTRITEAPPLP